MKKGLGRGLDSLFGGFEPEEEISKEEKKSQEEIAISLIDRNEEQPRKKFDEKALSELAESMKTYGVIQPLIVTKRGNRYMIVAGERRFRAAKMAGLKSVPVVVREMSDQEIREVALVENLQRENLNPIESARAIQELISKHNLTQEKISEKIGKSRSAVANTLRLLTLSPEVIKLVEEDKLSSGHARVLVVVKNEELQIRIAEMTVKAKLSVRELEKYVKEILNPKQKKEKKEQSLEIKHFVQSMQEKFSTKVSILGNDKKGKILIDYYNADDLQRIYDFIMKK